MPVLRKQSDHDDTIEMVMLDPRPRDMGRLPPLKLSDIPLRLDQFAQSLDTESKASPDQRVAFKAVCEAILSVCKRNRDQSLEQLARAMVCGGVNLHQKVLDSFYLLLNNTPSQDMHDKDKKRIATFLGNAADIWNNRFQLFQTALSALNDITVDDLIQFKIECALFKNRFAELDLRQQERFQCFINAVYALLKRVNQNDDHPVGADDLMNQLVYFASSISNLDPSIYYKIVILTTEINEAGCVDELAYVMVTFISVITMYFREKENQHPNPVEAETRLTLDQRKYHEDHILHSEKWRFFLKIKPVVLAMERYKKGLLQRFNSLAVEEGLSFYEKNGGLNPEKFEQFKYYVYHKPLKTEMDFIKKYDQLVELTKQYHALLDDPLNQDEKVEAFSDALSDHMETLLCSNGNIIHQEMADAVTSVFPEIGTLIELNQQCEKYLTVSSARILAAYPTLQAAYQQALKPELSEHSISLTALPEFHQLKKQHPTLAAYDAVSTLQKNLSTPHTSAIEKLLQFKHQFDQLRSDRGLFSKMQDQSLIAIFIKAVLRIFSGEKSHTIREFLITHFQTARRYAFIGGVEGITPTILLDEKQTIGIKR